MHRHKWRPAAINGAWERKATDDKNFTVNFSPGLCRKSVSGPCAGQWWQFHNHRKVERENRPPETASNPERWIAAKREDLLAPGLLPGLARLIGIHSPVDSSSNPWEVQQGAGESVLGKLLSEASPVGAWSGRGKLLLLPCAADNAVLEKSDPENGPKVQVKKQTCRRALVSGSRLRLGPVYQTLRQGLTTCIEDS